jgi:hypothetical protein
MKNFASKHATVVYLEEINAFHATFFNFVLHPEFVETLEFEYKMVEHYQLQNALIDLRQMKVYAEGNDDYIKTVWFPKMISLGLKKAAFVVPKDIFAKMTMQKAHTTKEVAISIEINHFQTIEEAKDWLRLSIF